MQFIHTRNVFLYCTAVLLYLGSPRDENETLLSETETRPIFFIWNPRHNRDLPKFSRDREKQDQDLRLRARDRDIQDRDRDIFRDTPVNCRPLCFFELPRRRPVQFTHLFFITGTNNTKVLGIIMNSLTTLSAVKYDNCHWSQQH